MVGAHWTIKCKKYIKKTGDVDTWVFIKTVFMIQNFRHSRPDRRGTECKYGSKIYYVKKKEFKK